MKGYINSFQSLGASDGPGLRYVVFMQGCPLRCGVCHNPDTWQTVTGSQYTADEITNTVLRYKEYFGKDGGITVSGGEPLIQSDFVTELFQKCKSQGINNCLDTSGCILNDKVKALLEQTDLILLDIKYTTEQDYQNYVGCSLKAPLEFLDYTDSISKPVWLRQVIVPTLNDNADSLTKLKDIANNHANVKRVELLPFRKICKTKYDNMGIEFEFDKYNSPTSSYTQELYDKFIK